MTPPKKNGCLLFGSFATFELKIQQPRLGSKSTQDSHKETNRMMSSLVDSPSAW